jgi:hypothetical protein
MYANTKHEIGPTGGTVMMDTLCVARRDDAVGLPRHSEVLCKQVCVVRTTLITGLGRVSVFI